jgi:hypothetical protein
MLNVFMRGKQGNRGFLALWVDLPVRTAHTAIDFQRTLHPTVKLAAREYSSVPSVVFHFLVSEGTFRNDEVKLVLGPRHGDVQQPSLFLNVFRLVQGN